MGAHTRLRSAFLSAACIYFVTAMATFSMAATGSRANGHKVKIKGPIVVHEGDVLTLRQSSDQC
jgi:hypothetical protein